MKTVVAVLFLILSSNSFAQGSSKLSCTSNEGIAFSSDNGLSQISIDSVTSDVEIENYSFGTDNSIATKVIFIGEPVILSESQENSCNRDYASTIFSQKIEIINNQIQSSKTLNVICTDELITSSGAELDECLE